MTNKPPYLPYGSLDMTPAQTRRELMPMWHAKWSDDEDLRLLEEVAALPPNFPHKMLFPVAKSHGRSRQGVLQRIRYLQGVTVAEMRMFMGLTTEPS